MSRNVFDEDSNCGTQSRDAKTCPCQVAQEKEEEAKDSRVDSELKDLDDSIHAKEQSFDQSISAMEKDSKDQPPQPTPFGNY